MTPFFITGLPQSRTTWLANFLSTGSVFCHHDLLGLVGSMAEFKARLRDDMATGRVGDSDSGLLSAWQPVMQAFPDAPWVLVIRDFEEAWQSLCEFVAEGPWSQQLSCTWELRERMSAEWAAARRGLTKTGKNILEVYFDQLDRTDTLEQVWRHCVPGVKFDRRRAEMLQTLSVRPFQAKSPMRPALSLVKELWQSGQQ
jgi:hypothetical protein